MSISSNRSAISRIHKDLADLQKKFADEGKKEAQLQQKIIQTHGSINKNTSANTLASKAKQIAGYESDSAKCAVNKADILKKVAAKKADLHRYESQLARDEETERKKQDAEIKKREKEQLEFQKKLTREVESRNRAVQTQIALSKQAHDSIPRDEDDHLQYDVFISHASEDKDDFVRPFAEHLKSLGVDVWYDEFSLKWGDSLRKKIDRGLANSKFGIVVISRDFVQKNWTEYELNGLVAKEINGSGRILPIWHNITKSEVINFSPSLADKMALSTANNTVEEIAEKLLPLLTE